MSQENLKIAEAYLAAMGNRDLEALGKDLHPQLRFKGPMFETNDRESFLETTKKLFPLLKRVDILARFEAQDQTLFVYDTVFADPLGPSRTTGWMTFEGGKIKVIEVLYDPRPFEKLFQSRQ